MVSKIFLHNQKLNTQKQVFLYILFLIYFVFLLKSITSYLLLCFVPLIVSAQVAPYPFNNAQKAYPVQEHYRYLCDSGNSLTPAQALHKFKEGKGLVWQKDITFNVGIQPYIYWFYLPISNLKSTSEEAILRLNTSITKLGFYEARPDGLHLIFEGSSFLPYNLRPFKHRDLAIPLQLPTKDTAYYLFSVDKRNRGLYMPIYIESPETMLRKEIDRHWVYGIYIGIFFFIIIFNLFLYFSLKDNIHLWYIGYILSEILFIFLDEHFYTEFFPNYLLGPCENAGSFPCSALMLAFSLKIMQLFLNQTKENGKLYYLVNIFIYVNFIVAGLIFILSFSSPEQVLKPILFLHRIVDYLFIISMILIVLSVILKMIQKQFLAKYYFIAIVLPFAGAIIFFLNHLGIITFNPIKPNGLVVGITAEMILLSILLVVRYNNFKREKETLQVRVNQHQDEMVQQIVNTQEYERKRIAEDLHDDLGGTLSTLRLQMSRIAANKDKDIPYYEESMELIKKATQDLRSIAYDLLPVDFAGLGLFVVLEQKIAQLNHHGLTRFSLVTEGNDKQLSTSLSLMVYRIINELITNITKHAQAAHADIQIFIHSHNIQVLVEDDGIGLDTHLNKKGMGLQNIKARVNFLNGDIHIDSSASGVSIIINIPNEDSHDESTR